MDNRVIGEEFGRFIEEVNRLYMAANSLIGDTQEPREFGVMAARLEESIAVLRSYSRRFHRQRQTDQVERLLRNLHSLDLKVSQLYSTILHLEGYLVEKMRYASPVVKTGDVGRPSFLITKEQLEMLASFSFSWTDIAKTLGVSISTVWRRRVQLGLVRQTRRIRGDELRSEIIRLQSENTAMGIPMIEGDLLSRGLRAPRSEIWQILRDYDRDSLSARWSQPVHRRKYSVKGPNSLWHIDGNHKLIRWRFVVHGGIDGYSRLIIYLKCATNNLSATVAKEFLEAVNEYGLPSRLRCDEGVENAQVRRVMVARRGEGRGSVLCGSSVHNQRIERLWKDVRRAVLQYFRNLFYFLEDNGLLEIDNEIDLFSLHWTFLPRINKFLELFRARWNNHKLSTCGSKTPNQLFITGLLNLYGSSNTAAVDVFERSNIDPESYGVEEDLSVAEPLDENDVVVPETACPVQPSFIAVVNQRTELFEGDQNHNISTYIKIRSIIKEYVSAPSSN